MNDKLLKKLAIFCYYNILNVIFHYIKMKNFIEILM